MSDARLWCTGRMLLGDAASGPLVVLAEPLSFWGGVDEKTGTIIDGHHPQFGLCLKDTVLLLAATRGSSSATSTFLECIRRRTAPAALLLVGDDPTLVIAVAAAWEMYGRGPTVLQLSGEPERDEGIAFVTVGDDGKVHAESLPATVDNALD